MLRSALLRSAVVLSPPLPYIVPKPVPTQVFIVLKLLSPSVYCLRNEVLLKNLTV